MGPVTAPASLPLEIPSAAALRAELDPFFRGFGFECEVELAKLAQWALGEALPPCESALSLSARRMEQWLAQVLGPAAEGESLLTCGRAAFVLSEAAAHGAEVLTTPVHALTPQLVAALRAALPQAAPPALPGAMPEQQLVLNPVAELLRRCWRASEPDMSLSR